MGTTIGAVLMSYDVDRLHNDVKNRLIDMGYLTKWNYTGQPNHVLPNTTVWHLEKSSDQAILDLKSVCRILGVTLEKAVAVKATEFAGI